MANPFSKGWKYVMSSLDQKIDENADPKVQIQQAVKAAKEQHQEISDHAAEIIGHKSQLEMQMNRLVKSQQDYQSQTERRLKAHSRPQPQPHKSKTSPLQKRRRALPKRPRLPIKQHQSLRRSRQ